jgi:hypothetical protein
MKGVKMIPPADCLGRARFGDNIGSATGWELLECLLMAMIWFILRYNDNVRFRESPQVFDVGPDSMLGEGKLRVCHDGVADEPWVAENREGLASIDRSG